jgi:hypothetical protein
MACADMDNVHPHDEEVAAGLHNRVVERGRLLLLLFPLV